MPPPVDESSFPTPATKRCQIPLGDNHLFSDCTHSPGYETAWSPGNSNKNDYNRNKNNRRTGGRREGNTTTGGKDKNWRSGPKPERQSDGSSNGRLTMTAG